MFIEVPKGWEKFYPRNVVLELLATLYGLKQSAFAFFVEVLRIMKDMKYNRSTADPCLFYYWGMFGLVLIVSWVDDMLAVGSEESLTNLSVMLQDRIDCEDLGDLKE